MRAGFPLILIASSLALTACGGGGDEAGGGGGEGGGESAGSEMTLVQPGILTVCADVPYPPFSFEEGGEYTGFDIELISEIASGMNLDVVVKDIGFEGLQSGAALAAGTCDIGAAAMTITEDREENLDFSDPYYESLMSLLVAKDADISSISDLSGKAVGVKQGTTGENYAQENVPEDAEIVSYPSNSELYPALKSGAVDGVLQGLPANLQHLEGGAFVIAEELETDEQYGYPVAEEGSEALLKGVNEQLAELRDNGTYQKIYDKYFTEQ